MIANGTAPKVIQSEEGATYDPIAKKDTAKIDWTLTGKQIHDFIRGHDKVPGAWTNINGEVNQLRLTRLEHISEEVIALDLKLPTFRLAFSRASSK